MDKQINSILYKLMIEKMEMLEKINGENVSKDKKAEFDKKKADLKKVCDKFLNKLEDETFK